MSSILNYPGIERYHLAGDSVTVRGFIYDVDTGILEERRDLGLQGRWAEGALPGAQVSGVVLWCPQGASGDFIESDSRCGAPDTRSGAAHPRRVRARTR